MKTENNVFRPSHSQLNNMPKKDENRVPKHANLCYNRLGDPVSGVDYEYKDKSYGSYSAEGYAEPNYKDFVIGGDEHGFDTTNKDNNGKYVKLVSLERGTIIARYGGDYGHYSAPVGTAYDKLGLPFKEDTLDYHEYMVTSDDVFSGDLTVQQGFVAPAFDSNGGAVQYYHKESIREAVKMGKLIEVTGWLDDIRQAACR